MTTVEHEGWRVGDKTIESEIESDSLSAAYSDAVSVAFDEVTIEAGPGEGLELLLTEHEETGFSGAIEMITES